MIIQYAIHPLSLPWTHNHRCDATTLVFFCFYDTLIFGINTSVIIIIKKKNHFYTVKWIWALATASQAWHIISNLSQHFKFNICCYTMGLYTGFT